MQNKYNINIINEIKIKGQLVRYILLYYLFLASVYEYKMLLLTVS